MLEGICTVLGLIQGVLVAFNKRSNWIFYLLQMAGLFVFSLMNRLYGDMVNDAVYFIIGIVGLIRWGQEKHSRITSAGAKERLIYSALIVAATGILFAFLRTTDDPLPLLDAFTTVSSFAATYYMMMKKLDAWILWFINDIFYIAEYFMLPDKAILLGILNIVWTALAVYSFFRWRGIMMKEKVTE